MDSILFRYFFTNPLIRMSSYVKLSTKDCDYVICTHAQFIESLPYYIKCIILYTCYDDPERFKETFTKRCTI